MSTITATIRTLPDTRAAVVRSGPHTLVVDRPDGVAGGQGLGFSGGQLLASALGGCLANDLHAVAAHLGVELDTVSVDVSLVVDGTSVVDGVTFSGADLSVSVTAPDGVDTSAVVERALAGSAVLAAVRAGMPVETRVR